MELERFGKFTLLVDGIYKSIHKIKLDTAPYLGIKSVHVFWVYSLRAHPDGLTSTELAAITEIDRSLVSREIEELCEKGFIKMERRSEAKRRNYNALLTLTPEGERLGRQIVRTAMKVQDAADAGIREKDLIPMYSTLLKIYNNLSDTAEAV